MKLITVFEYKELVVLHAAIVVERWDSKNYGRVRRAWLMEFTEEERAKAGRLYKTFYQWYMVTGVPQEHRMSTSTYAFAQRLINFFAMN